MAKFYFRLAAAATVLLSVGASTMAQSKAFDTSRMDSSVEACDDFFSYANGTWVKNTAIPPAYSRWGTFNILADNNQNVLHEILDGAAAKSNAAKGSDEQLVGDFYSSCMDEAAIEKAGTTPLEPYFKKIDGMKDASDLPATIAFLHAAGFPGLFNFGSGADAKNSSVNIANANQGGLSLPNRDFYTKEDPKSAEIRTKFVEYVTNMHKLTGATAEQAASDAKTIMDIQLRLAKASKSPIEIRNPEARYNKKKLDEIAEMTPNFSWTDYLKGRGVPPITEMNIGQPAFFTDVNAMVKEVPVAQWKTYLRWMVLNASANALPKAFVDENFNFFSKFLQGTKEQQPRWRRCASATDQAVGESLGKEFVKQKFTPEAQKRMGELIDNLFAAYRERLSTLEWMSPATREKALAKLNAYQRKIGFNQNPRGYQGLVLSRKSFFDNARSVSKFEINRNLQDVGKPVDKTRWGMTPPTVNAYYNPSFNEIVFPAGILQPPFFNAAADDAINYGAIGAVIGHEITHGFDDSGSQFDASGNLKSWWTAEDRKLFEERAMCVSKQFDGYEVQPGVFIQGKLTLGENIADLGGLNMAYKAYMKSLEGKSRPAAIDGFTPEQRFFLGYAQVWSSKATPEFEINQTKTDSHSNARYRVNGPLSNLPQFAKAFGCKENQKMVRKDFCQIW